MEPHRRPDETEVAISARALRVSICAASGLVVLAGLASNLGTFWIENPSRLTVQLLKAFGLDNELNVPTWYAAFLLAWNGLFLWLLGAHARAAGLPDGRAWKVLGAVFLFLSLDEVATLHEHMGLFVAEALGTPGRAQAWVIVALPLVLLLAALYARALFRLPRWALWQIVAAGALYVGGAAGLEAVGWGAQLARPGWSESYLMLTWVEEALEFAGQALFFWALLGLLAQRRARFGFG